VTILLVMTSTPPLWITPAPRHRRFRVRALVWTGLLVIAATAPALAALRGAQVAEPPPESAQLEAHWLLRGPPSEGLPESFPPHLTDANGPSGGRLFATTTAGAIWVSSDSGRTWATVHQADRPVRGLGFRDEGVGIAIGDGGLIARTMDGGETWEPVGWEPSNALRRVVYSETGTAFAVGGGLVIRSDDDGDIWSSVEVPARNYYALAFRGQRGLIVGGAGLLLLSEDGGESWVETGVDVGGLLRGVAFVDDRRAVAVGSDGLLLRTEDGGRTWARVVSPTTQHLRDVAFYDEAHGVAVGYYGTILLSRDGGRNWTEETSGSQAHLTAVHIVSPGAAVVAGWFHTLLLGGESLIQGSSASDDN